MAAKSSTRRTETNVLSYLVVLAVIAVVSGAIIYVYKAQQLATFPEETQVTEPAAEGEEIPPTPTPTPTKLFHGKDTYYISGGAPDDPHFQQVDVDPLDPEVGANQKFTVKISSKYPVTTAYLTVHTDTHSTKVPLNLISGTREEGIWEGSWTIAETYLYTYLIVPTAQTQYTQASSTITVRQRP